MSMKRFETNYSDFNNYYYYIHGMWPSEKHIFCAPEEYHNNILKSKI